MEDFLNTAKNLFAAVCWLCFLLALTGLHNAHPDPSSQWLVNTIFILAGVGVLWFVSWILRQNPNDYKW